MTLCLTQELDEDYANLELWATHWKANSKPKSELGWPAGLRVDDKMLILQTRMELAVQEWQERQLFNPVWEKMR